MELADFRNEHYSLPALRHDYAGLIACPQGSQPVDIHSFQESEIRYRYTADGYNSLVVQSEDYVRVQWLLQDFAKRLVC